MSEESMIERVAKAILEAMDLMDGLDGVAAETYARAAIEAMREPTDGMVEAALDLGPDRAGETYYAAMIDAALT